MTQLQYIKKNTTILSIVIKFIEFIKKETHDGEKKKIN